MGNNPVDDHDEEDWLSLKLGNEIKKSPTDALIGSAGGGDPEVIRYFLFLIFYLFILLIFSNFFPPLIAFILWIAMGFGIYKVAENYGEEVPWIKQVLEKVQNIGFTSTSPDTTPEAIVAGVDEPEEEKAADLDNYAEKFDEWRVTKDTIAPAFVSAGDRITSFSFNSDGLYKFRLWIFILVVPFFWFLLFAGGGILPTIFGIWYTILGFSIGDATLLSGIVALFLSYFLLIRIYSHCTNKRKIPFDSEIMSDYDPYVVLHLFQNPKGKSTFSVTSKALLLNFIGGWFILIFLTVVQNEAPLENTIFQKININEYFSLVMILVLLSVATPVIEELLFRGLILDSLSESYGSWTSIFISSVIFAVLHFFSGPLSILNAFWGGMIYGYVRMRTNSLWPSIFLHSMWNGHIVLLQFFYLL